MRRIVIALMTTISGLSLLFSYHTSTNSTGGALVGATTAGTEPAQTGGSQTAPAQTEPAQTAPAQAAGTQDDGPAPASPTPSTPSTAAPSTAANGSKASGQFTGDTVTTRWGPVQVQIVVKNGKVVGSDVLQVPWSNHRDQEINQVAVPILNQEVLAGQSATIDGVSGATVTSDGYRQSLQSAFDRAHL